MRTYIEIILLEYIFSLILTREFCLLCAHGKDGANTISFLLAAHFAKRNTKFGGGGKKLESESEGGAGIHFPHTPFSSRHARAEKFSALPREARQSKFSVRIFVKKSSDFVQKAPPIYNFSVLREVCLALAMLGLGIYDDFIRIFEIQKQFLPAQTEVRFAEGKHKLKNLLTNLFCSASGGTQSGNLITAQKRL